MIRLGVVIQETWNFFNEIYAEMQRQYETSLFKRRFWSYPVFNNRINEYLFTKDIRSFMRANNVVFFEWASELLVAATQQPKTCGIVTRLHRYELYQWADRVNWDAVDKIILVSQAKKNEFITKFPGQSHKTAVISPSTSLKKFTPQTASFNGNIGILCNLVPRKRVYELILCFYELQKQRSGLRLHIAGGKDPANEDYYIALLNIVHELNLQDKVIFYGNVTDPWNWYHQIDIFISNSYSEGLQVAPMEAMASGCYCLAHKWAGADELLPEENLYYTNNELQEIILKYCDTTDAYKDEQKLLMRKIACEKFDINNTIHQIGQIIEEVASINGITT